MTLEHRKTLLAEQHWDDAIRPHDKERLDTVEPIHNAPYTKYRIWCPGCGADDIIESYHGTNCFAECMKCGQAIGPF